MAAILLVFQPPCSLLAEEDEEYGSIFARVRYAEGALTLQKTQEGEITEAGLNSPLAPGDILNADGGRAEIALADGSVVWLEEGTRLNLRSLADIENRYERSNLFALENGSLRIESVEPGKDAAFRVDTQAGSVYLLSGGSFRIDAEEDTTTVSSFRGVAEVSGDAGSVLVRTGERSSVRPGRTPSDPRAFNTLRQDDFDRFCETRGAAYLRHDDNAIDTIEEDIPREVSPYVQELTVYGGWHMVPDYGWVWRPTYYGTWAPYVNGYWTWCPTGWAWVSYDVWGWAPYHYGRWDFYGSLGWVWIPGRVWSGAWVSFAVGPSYVGWCPLNYYNRPVFHDSSFVNVININVTRLDARGWRFVPLSRFGDRRGERNLLRADRLPRGTEVVVSRRLPQFSPKEFVDRPERGRDFVERVRSARAPLPAAGPPDRPVSFRNLERGWEGRRPVVRREQVAPRRRPALDRFRPRLGQGPAGEGVIRSPNPRGGSAPGARPDGLDRPSGAKPREANGNPGRPEVRSREPGRPAPMRRVEPRMSPPQPQTRARDPRGGQVVEKLFEGVRRDRAQMRGPAREQARVEKKAVPRESKGQPKNEPSRPPRKEKEKER